MNALEIRKYFPIYQKNPNLVYMDTGATSLKPSCVLDKMEEYYREYGVNIHRGVYKLSYQATDMVDIARVKVPTFEYDAKNSKVSIKCETKNATIYYTTDETDPTTSSTEYKEPIDFTEGMIIKAFAVFKDMVSSDVATFKFVKISYSSEYDEAPEGKSVIVGTTHLPNCFAAPYTVVVPVNNTTSPNLTS